MGHQALAVCSATWGSHKSGSTFTKAMFILASPVEPEEILPPCGHFLKLQLENHCLRALHFQKIPALDECPRVCNSERIH